MTDAPVFTVSAVMSEFLGSAPTLQEIIAFKLPEPLEQRALDLLRRQRQEALNDAERTELDEFTRMGHFMNRVKLQARLKLAENS
jgi:hypothetical protein